MPHFFITMSDCVSVLSATSEFAIKLSSVTMVSSPSNLLPNVFSCKTKKQKTDLCKFHTKNIDFYFTCCVTFWIDWASGCPSSGLAQQNRSLLLILTFKITKITKNRLECCISSVSILSQAQTKCQLRQCNASIKHLCCAFQSCSCSGWQNSFQSESCYNWFLHRQICSWRRYRTSTVRIDENQYEKKLNSHAIQHTKSAK